MGGRLSGGEGLEVGFGEGDAGGAAVDDASDGAAMGFAEGGHAKKGSK